jgi:hypothetical protein
MALLVAPPTAGLRPLSPGVCAILNRLGGTKSSNSAGPREWVQITFIESVEVSREPRASDGTDRLCGDRLSLPNVQDCYDRANLSMDMWNRSDEHANCSWLLRTAGAWLQLAFELHKRL